MTLGAAAAAQVRLIVWCKAISIRLSPTLPKWLPGTAPKRPRSIGASGWLLPMGRPGCRFRRERDHEAMSLTAGAMLH
jgi:hypothetical protein